MNSNSNRRLFVLVGSLGLGLSALGFFSYFKPELSSVLPLVLLNAVAWLLAAGGSFLVGGRPAVSPLAVPAERSPEEPPKRDEILPPRSETTKGELVAFLSLLQRKGRFVDFMMDDIVRYDDAQVGAAARIVHQGCASVLRDYFQIEPVRSDAEGEMITVGAEYDADRYSLVGKVKGLPPFRGTLVHRGWRTSEVKLPWLSAGHPPSGEIIAPAEVELN